ncbi:hypothetical protein K9M48_04055 [Candidatus Gracilibacteria bacterium]|nr:hypothetical protein [Candidatus Gracilibacteria bacterium]
MTNGGDPIEKLMEGKQVSFEDKEKEESKHIEDIQEDLNKEKEINEAQQESKEELSIFSLITRTELLIDKYKELKKEANKLSKNKEDKGYEKEHKSQIENRIRRLEQIKKFLNRYEKKPEHLSAKSLARYDRELLGFQNEIDQFEERRDFIVLEKASGLTPYKIDIHTFKDAKEIRSAYDKVNDMLRKLNSLELDAALRTELKEELEGLQKYLEESINGTIDAGKQPFVLKHWQDFIQLGIIDPTLSNYIVPETTYKKEDKDNNTSVDQPNYVIDKDGNKVCRPVVNYNSPGEARKKGGILGAMDYMLAKTNMTPQQRQFWKGAGNLALVGGGIYLGWKALSSILGFGKDKGKNRRKWIGGIVGGTLLLQGATGKSPIQAIKELFNGGDVTERISGRLGGGVEGSDIGPDTPQEVITYYHGFTGVPAMFAGLKISELKTIIKKDTNGKMKIENYDALALRLDNSKNTAAADIVRKLKIDNDPHNIIHLTLEGMGLNRDKIQEGGDMLFEKYSVDALDRLISINDFMEQNKYEKMNIDGLRDDVKNYVATGNPSLVALEKAGLFSTDGKTEKVAETDLDIKNFNEANDTLGLKDKVDSLSVSENQKKILVAAGNLLSKETNNNKNIEFKEFGGNVYLKTYGEWTPINVARKTISGLDYNSVDIFFESTMEMIKVANLTNYIKKLFRGRSQNLDRPFEITSAVDWIRLNGVGDLVYKEKDKDPNLKRYEIKKYDPSYTEVIDSGWGGDLKGISPILNKYTNEYANYLNSLDIRHVNSKSKNIPN